MLRTPGQANAPEGHPSKQFTYENLKKYVDEKGEVTINRREEEPVLTAAINGLKLSPQSEVVEVAA